jgi:hypothetical protein
MTAGVRRPPTAASSARSSEQADGVPDAGGTNTTIDTPPDIAKVQRRLDD